MSCSECDGQGSKYYPNTATYISRPGIIVGQAFTKNICDMCWGSGDSNQPFKNLREAQSELSTTKAQLDAANDEISLLKRTYNELFDGYKELETQLAGANEKLRWRTWPDELVLPNRPHNIGSELVLVEYSIDEEDWSKLLCWEVDGELFFHGKRGANCISEKYPHIRWLPIPTSEVKG